MLRRLISIGLPLLLIISCAEAAQVENPYVGRYELAQDMVLDVRIEEGLLTLLPSFWRTAQILDSIAPDTFVSLLHREIVFAFERDSEGRVDGVTVSGHQSREIDGRARRLHPGESNPVAALLDGDVETTLRLLDAEHALATPDRAVHLGSQLMFNYPSRGRVAAEFLERVGKVTEPSEELFSALGLAWLVTGDRGRAAAAFGTAAALSPGSGLAGEVLRIIRPGTSAARPVPASAWQVPFSLDEVFAGPTDDEVRAVRAEWAERDLAARGVAVVASHALELPATLTGGTRIRYDVRILAHDVHGDRHFGAILVPKGAGPGCCPVVLEAHGIDFRYSGMDLHRARTPAILEGAATRTVILVPSFRGEELRVDSVSYRSEGDPKNGWDGATDDAIAFLNAALTVTPEIDQERICVFGKSRGGTVALLMGVRDPWVDCVVDWAGPAGWFEHMGTRGFTLQEQVQWGLWERWEPGDGMGSASQFIDQLLADLVDENDGSPDQVRRRMLASSPIYFLDDLPAAELHYGVEDAAVPAANAAALRAALRARQDATPFAVHVHDGSGHDQPYPTAFERSRDFLVRHLSP